VTAFLDPPLPTTDDRSARAASLRSRDAVQRGDKDAWLAIFADDAVVQDPVGVSPLDETGLGHHGRAAISAFWDNVIAANPIRMDLRSSFAGGNEVANAIRMTTTLPDGTQVGCELIAVYRVGDDGLVRSLRAFWEFDAVEFTPPA
jgi:ketosteroid isomerase-like protein